MEIRQHFCGIAFFLLALSPIQGSAQDSKFELEHTRLGPQIIRVYAYGSGDTSIRDAMASALTEARRLCQQQGYKQFALIDQQTLYRQQGVRKQPSYTQRGQFEARGVRLDGSSRDITNGNIDIDYSGGSQARNNRTNYSTGLQVNTNEDPRLNSYSRLSRPSERAWAGITIQLLEKPDTANNKEIYRADGVQP